MQDGFAIYIYILKIKNAFGGRGHYVKKDGTEYLGNFFEGKKNGFEKYLF